MNKNIESAELKFMGVTPAALALLEDSWYQVIRTEDNTIRVYMGDIADRSNLVREIADDEEAASHISAVLMYDQFNFLEMIRDWQADHAPEYDDLVIDGDPVQNADGWWVVSAHDNKTSYTLTDDGKGNIIINYVGTR